jgi:hypothetical protein
MFCCPFLFYGDDMIIDDKADQTNLYATMTQRWYMNVEMPFVTSDEKPIILPMSVLSGRELYEAKQFAERDTRLSYGKDVPKKDEASEWDQKYEDHLAYWTIYYSLKQPNDVSKRFFPNKEAVMDCLMPDQVAILANDYLTVTINQPWLTYLDNDNPDKLEAVVERLIADAKDPHFFLNSLTSLAQTNLINFMAAKLAKLQTVNG